MLQLNDPYESKHIYSDEAEKVALERFKKGGLKIDFPDKIKQVVESDPLFEQTVLSTIFNVASFNKFGVLCLSRTPYSNLMWSHYTSNEGFVIGFDNTHDFFYKKNLGPLWGSGDIPS